MHPTPTRTNIPSPQCTLPSGSPLLFPFWKLYFYSYKLKNYINSLCLFSFLLYIPHLSENIYHLNFSFKFNLLKVAPTVLSILLQSANPHVYLWVNNDLLYINFTFSFDTYLLFYLVFFIA